MKYYVGTIDGCRSIVSRIDSALGYPSPETRTVTYAVPEPHGSLPGQYYIPLKGVWSPAERKGVTDISIEGQLLPDESSGVRSEDQFRSEGGIKLNIPGGL